MSDKRKAIRWIAPLGIFLGLNLIMLLFDSTSWTLNFREGAFIERLMNSKFFSEWFTPYSTPEFNVLTVLFVIIFLPETLIKLIEFIKARRQISN
ncbi:YfzA family protein [Oceanobacillus caeni]|uniref:YfzA family protein n=1 Tax=Oceanobacillus caeni TaxID=405946 RepID=UPI00195674AA